MKQKEYKIRWQEVLVGAVLLSLIGLVPIVGWVIVFIFMLISFGALCQLAYKSFRK